MLLEIPSSLLEYESNRYFYLSPSVELIYYNNKKRFSKHEVKLNKNMFLFILKGTKKIALYNESITLAEGYGAFVAKDIYFMSEIASQTENCFSSLIILVEDEKLIELWRNAVKLYSLSESDENDDITNWTVFNQSNHVKSALKTLEFFSKENQKIPHTLVETKLQELLFYIASTNLGKDIGKLIKRMGSKENRHKLKIFMEENYTQRWCLDEYAKKFGFSLSTFKRLFKEVYGTTPKLWINDQRLKKAAKEIAQKKDASLLGVALDVGFSSSSQFSKAFKRKYKCPPSQFLD